MVLRALLACFWLIISLTATMTSPAAAEMPCHESSPHHEKKTLTLQSVMPCCSQPTLPAGESVDASPARFIRTERMMPEAARPLANLPARLEPRPPK